MINSEQQVTDFFKNLKHMKRLITHKNSFVIALLFATTQFLGQTKHVESFNASEDMVVEVNTSYTNVIFETWNKNKVEVEAFIDDNTLSDAKKKDLLDAWNFNVLGNSKKVVITSNSHGDMSNYNYDYNSDEMQFNMSFLGPLLESINIPEMPGFDMPEMPEELMRGVGNINFDYDAYQENEEEYMKKFEKQMEDNFGPEFEAKMEAWGENFGREWEEKHGAEWEAKMEAWGEKFGKDMEEWGENFAKQFEENSEELEKQAKEMEIMAEKMSKEHEAASKNHHKLKKVKKTIIIKMPKNTKTEVNVRHGELKMADAYNVKATLNYSTFIANSIDGGQTLINAAYAPVSVENWIDGSLNVNYVEDCNIKNVEKINLQAISSDVLIGTINKTAIVSGSIGKLQINSVSNNFSDLHIVLENSDAILNLPKTAHSFYYNGKKTRLEIPVSSNLKLNKSVVGDLIIQKGYNYANTNEKSININASFSNVIIK
tara:strand:+ start:71666 stop:73126 length:1461 start_codon:yes stop_codon:yes gene_type:complete